MSRYFWQGERFIVVTAVMIIVLGSMYLYGNRDYWKERALIAEKSQAETLDYWQVCFFTERIKVKEAENIIRNRKIAVDPIEWLRQVPSDCEDYPNVFIRRN